LDGPAFEYFKSDAFVGSLAAGGSVNCERISFYPHASGTHTECALHVLPVDFDMRSIQIPVLQMCKIVSVLPSQIGSDKCIDMAALKDLHNQENFEAKIEEPEARGKHQKNPDRNQSLILQKN
jgi:hypothetical protein